MSMRDIAARCASYIGVARQPNARRQGDHGWQDRGWLFGWNDLSARIGRKHENSNGGRHGQRSETAASEGILLGVPREIEQTEFLAPPVYDSTLHANRLLIARSAAGVRSLAGSMRDKARGDTHFCPTVRDCFELARRWTAHGWR